MIYIKSNGTEVDTETMNDVYIERALNKARQENNEANINALEVELAKRKEQQ